MKFDDDCIAAVTAGVATLGLPNKVMVSGVAPTSMIFVPCKDGISHNEAEEALPADLAAGCEVLFQAMCKMAEA